MQDNVLSRAAAGWQVAIGAAVGAVVGGVAGANARQIAKRLPGSIPRLKQLTGVKRLVGKTRKSASTNAAQRSNTKRPATSANSRKRSK